MVYSYKYREDVVKLKYGYIKAVLEVEKRSDGTHTPPPPPPSYLLIDCPPKVWKHPWQSVVLDDISINPYHFLVQMH